VVRTVIACTSCNQAAAAAAAPYTAPRGRSPRWYVKRLLHLPECGNLFKSVSFLLSRSLQAFGQIGSGASVSGVAGMYYSCLLCECVCVCVWLVVVELEVRSSKLESRVSSLEPRLLGAQIAATLVERISLARLGGSRRFQNNIISFEQAEGGGLMRSVSAAAEESRLVERRRRRPPAGECAQAAPLTARRLTQARQTSCRPGRCTRKRQG
jgi:hypothetical protein